jgi:hypothetical protein
MSEFLALKLTREILHLQNKEIKCDVVPKCLIALCDQYFLNLMNTILKICDLSIDEIKLKLIDISEFFDDIRNEWQDLFIMYDKIQREKQFKYTQITYFHVLYAIYLLVYSGSNDNKFIYFQQIRGSLNLYDDQKEIMYFNDEQFWKLMHAHNFKSKLPETSINSLTVYTLVFAIEMMVKQVAMNTHNTISINTEYLAVRTIYKLLQSNTIFKNAFRGCKISFQVQYQIT